MAKYSNSKEPEEEYIDLAPILQNLYFDVDEVMSQIREVKSSIMRSTSRTITM